MISSSRSMVSLLVENVVILLSNKIIISRQLAIQYISSYCVERFVGSLIGLVWDWKDKNSIKFGDNQSEGKC
jgi:hypothetical protein